MLILLLGTLLRLYHLGDQFAWVNEYETVGFCSAPDWAASLTFARFFGQDTTPFGYFCYYWWGRLAGTESAAVFRLLGITVNVIAIALLWETGRYMHSRAAGQVAALLLALSPAHIWVAQTIRINVYIELLALVSIYVLLRALREERPRWWVLHGLANLLLVWTHPFTLFLLCAEGAVILLRIWRRPGGTVAWFAVQGGIVLSVAVLWLRSTLTSVATAAQYFDISQMARVALCLTCFRPSVSVAVRRGRSLGAAYVQPYGSHIPDYTGTDSRAFRGARPSPHCPSGHRAANLSTCRAVGVD